MASRGTDSPSKRVNLNNVPEKIKAKNLKDKIIISIARTQFVPRSKQLAIVIPRRHYARLSDNTSCRFSPDSQFECELLSNSIVLKTGGDLISTNLSMTFKARGRPIKQ